MCEVKIDDENQEIPLHDTLGFKYAEHAEGIRDGMFHLHKHIHYNKTENITRCDCGCDQEVADLEKEYLELEKSYIECMDLAEKHGAYPIGYQYKREVPGDLKEVDKW